MLIQPVILSGGSGSRLWPLSREAYPKQFLRLTDQRSLFQHAVTRLAGLGSGQSRVELADVLVVCNSEHRFLVREQVAELKCSAAAVILEPCGRNTAPALTVAALHAAAQGPDSILVAMPSDHSIRDEPGFCRAVETAQALARADKVVTFGIVPTVPETGFGYLKRGAELAPGAFRLSAFVEKPDVATADRYLKSGDYFWNSGIFVLKASLWLGLIERFCPDVFSACAAAFGSATRDAEFLHLPGEAFSVCPSESIDYAVMEKLPGAADSGCEPVVVPFDAGWSDLGSWASLYDEKPKDAQGNVASGDTVSEDAHDNLLLATDRLVAAVGVRDLVVVETADAVLVAHKSRAQDVKKVAEGLKRGNRSEHCFHRRVHRPWGFFESIDSGHRFQVKRLTVKPGAALSLQLHHHRAEHWIVVSGTARVTRGDEVFLLSENQATYIPVGTQHRLENPGTIALEIVEVQSGSYLGEDDIVRFEDDYNRLV